MHRSERPASRRGLLIAGRSLATLAIVASALIICGRALRISWGPLAYLVPLTPYLAVVLGLTIVLTILTRFWAGAVAAIVALLVVAIWWAPPFLNNPGIQFRTADRRDFESEVRSRRCLPVGRTRPGPKRGLAVCCRGD